MPNATESQEVLIEVYEQLVQLAKLLGCKELTLIADGREFKLEKSSD